MQKIKKTFYDKKGISETPTVLVVVLIVCILLIFALNLVGALSAGLRLGSASDNVAKQIQINGEISKATIMLYETSVKDLDVTEPSLEITTILSDGTTNTYLFKTSADGSKNYSINNIDTIKIQLGDTFTIKTKGKAYVGLSSKNTSSARILIGGKGQGVSEIFWKDAS